MFVLSCPERIEIESAKKRGGRNDADSDDPPFVALRH